MRSETVTTVVDAGPDDAFAWLADIENLPAWATEFARELRREDPDYKVVNGLGEFFFEIRANPDDAMFQAPDMPDELFESQHASLQREFRNIEAHLRRR